MVNFLLCGTYIHGTSNLPHKNLLFSLDLTMSLTVIFNWGKPNLRRKPDAAASEITCGISRSATIINVSWYRAPWYMEQYSIECFAIVRSRDFRQNFFFYIPICSKFMTVLIWMFQMKKWIDSLKTKWLEPFKITKY